MLAIASNLPAFPLLALQLAETSELDIDPFQVSALLIGALLPAALGSLVLLRARSRETEPAFDTSVRDVSTGHPLRTIWTQPRATMRGILDRNPDRLVLAIMAVAGIDDALTRASGNSAGDEISTLLVIGIAFAIGPLFGLLRLFAGSLLLHAVLVLMGGSGSWRETRSAYAWGSVVGLAFSLLYWAVLLPALGGEMFRFETPRMDASAVRLGVYNVATGATFTAGIWSFVSGVLCLSEAHRLSAWACAAAHALLLLVIFGIAAFAVAMAGTA